MQNPVNPFWFLTALYRRDSVNGGGLVFDPDPLTSAGQTYSGQYQDFGDHDIPELNAERKEVSLRDITRGEDGLYRLVGPHVCNLQLQWLPTARRSRPSRLQVYAIRRQV